MTQLNRVQAVGGSLRVGGNFRFYCFASIIVSQLGAGNIFHTRLEIMKNKQFPTLDFLPSRV